MPDVPPALAVPAEEVVKILTHKIADMARDLAVMQVQLALAQQRLTAYEQAAEARQAVPLTAVAPR